MDDLNDYLIDAAVRDRALEWLKSHEKELMGLAGHEPAAERKAIVRMILSGKLSADAYTDIRKELGDKAAQSVINSHFSILSTFLRLNGESIRVEGAPVFRELSALPKDEEPEEAPSNNACTCLVDQDGKCDACWDRLYRFWKAAGQTVEIMRDAGMENRLLCKPCLKRHLDASLAQFVTRDLSRFSLAAAEAAMHTMIASSQAFQKLPMPLTTMAWNNLVKGKKDP